MANEKRLIDANALMDAIEVTDWYHISPKGYLQKGANSQIHTPLFKTDDIIQALKDAPTEDAVEVVHGHWGKTAVEAGDPYDGNSVFCFDVFQCSECGECFDVSDAFNYCPNCGAKMDGGKGDV